MTMAEHPQPDYHALNEMEHEFGMVHEPSGLHPAGQCHRCDKAREPEKCHVVIGHDTIKTWSCSHDV